MTASIVICTFNRSSFLKDVFRSVTNQDFEKRDYEIIIVDNNSTDSTRHIANELAASTEIKVRYFFEQRQGLSYARNAGLSVAQGEIVCYIDDDVEVQRDWLQALVAVFNDPLIACAGGPVRPIWSGEKPSWLTPEWEWCLSINEFSEACKNGEFKWPRDLPLGANMAFRKEVLSKIGFFPVHLGRVGACLLSGEEVSICKKILENGFRIACSANAVAYHKINVERMEKRWFYNRLYWEGRTNAILEGKYPLIGIWKGFCHYCSTFRLKGVTDFSKHCSKMVAIGYLDQSFRSIFFRKVENNQ